MSLNEPTQPAQPQPKPRKYPPPSDALPPRTAVVVNPDGILLVKHNKQNEWALPGGRLMAAEEPSRRAVLEVAEETGIIVADPVHMGRYAGTVASHEIFLAKGEGTPRPNRRELQDAIWSDLKAHERPTARQRYLGHCQSQPATERRP